MFLAETLLTIKESYRHKKSTHWVLFGITVSLEQITHAERYLGIVDSIFLITHN